MAEGEAVVSAVGIIKRFGVGETVVHALRGVSIELHRGEFVALSGPSGCGKSTILNIFGLADAPDEGSVTLRGVPVDFKDEGLLLRLRRSSVGYVFQHFHLLPTLTAQENVLLTLLVNGVPPREAASRARTLLQEVGLAHRADHRPGALSGGERQRVAICRAVAHDPPLLLADEPTGNLDSHHGRIVLDLLVERAARGTTILMATHSPEAESRACRVIRLRDGMVRGEEETGETVERC